MREPNSPRPFSAGPSNDMSGSLGFFILNQFSCLVEFHFHFIWIILSFRKYADFKSKKKKVLCHLRNNTIIWFALEKLAENIIEFSSIQISSQMVTQSLELTTSPWSRNISNLK